MDFKELKNPTTKFNLPVYYNRLCSQEKRMVREQYMKQQGHRCYWCEEDLWGEPPERITNKLIFWDNFPKGFLNNPVHLQHCHNSGLTEGAVHAYCNAVMWQYHGR
jgi:hypothetical protein